MLFFYLCLWNDNTFTINLQYIDKVRMQNSFINKWHIIIMNIIYVICRQRKYHCHDRDVYC